MRTNAFAATLSVLFVAACASTPSARDYFRAAGSSEHADSGRTSLFDTSRISWQMPPAVDEVSNRDLTGLWAAVGDDAARYALWGVIASAGLNRPTVSAIEPRTLVERWRTVLPPPAGGLAWNYPGAIAVHANGDVYAVYSTRIARIDAATGSVKSVGDLPAPNGADHTTYNGFVVLPDGMILAKSHHRKPDCPVQGYRAFIECGVDGLAPSALVLLDQDLKTVWVGAAPELIGGRVTAIRHRARTYVYLAGADHIHRMIYEGTSLSIDPAWGPVRYREAGQTPGTAVVAFGDFVVVQNNAVPTATPLTVLAVSQDDSRIVHRLTPFVPPAPISFMPSKVSTDWVNRRLYTASAYDGLSAFDFDPVSGFRLAWRAPQPTGSFITLVGSPQDRLVIATDMSGAEPDAYGAPLHRQEALVWRRAADGAEIARRRDLPRNFGLTLVPDDLGGLYYATASQGLFRLSLIEDAR